MRITTSLTLVCAAFLASCATSPSFRNERQPADAVIRVENSGFGSAMSGDATVMIEAIDGARTSIVRRGAVYYVRPGKHELALNVSTITLREARQYLEVDVAADRKYRLSAVRKDSDFFVEFADESDPKAVTVISTVKMKAAMAHILPIPIPVK